MSNRTSVSALAGFAAVLLAACSSSSGAGGGAVVGHSELVAKLKTEPQIQQLAKVGVQTGDGLVDCIATALEKDTDQGALKKYVDGKVTIAELNANASTASAQAQTDVQNCAVAAVAQVSATATPS